MTAEVLDFTLGGEIEGFEFRFTGEVGEFEVRAFEGEEEAATEEGEEVSFLFVSKEGRTEGRNSG